MSGKDNNIPIKDASPNQARVSVIIVTYNAAAHLQKCLDSIYAQASYPAIDIIVIDGQSTDGTVELLQKNASRLYYWTSEKDTGIYDAMNKALKYINGQWVYFIGADDELLPEFSDMLSELDNPTAIYYSNVLVNGQKHSGRVSDYYMAKGGIYHQAIIYPKSVFTNYVYNTRYKIAADYALNMRLYKDRHYHFTYLEHTICKYNPDGISGRQEDTAFENDKTRLILTNFGWKIGLRYLFRQLKAKARK